MSDQLLPDFDGPGSQPDAARPGPKKPRRKPAKKKARAAPAPKAAKRVPKKRRVRKILKSPTELGVTPGISALWSGKVSEALGALMNLPAESRKLVLTVAQALTK